MCRHYVVKGPEDTPYYGMHIITVQYDTEEVVYVLKVYD